MTTVLNKRNKRRKQKSGIQGGSKINVNTEQHEAQIMKLKPNVNEEVSTLVNGHASNDTEVLANSHYQAGERCQHCQKEFHNGSSTVESPDHHQPQTAHHSPPTSTEQPTTNMTSNGLACASAANSVAHIASELNALKVTDFHGTKVAEDFVKSCTCNSCVERRTIEAEHLLDSQLRHAWTQVRHLVRCAYHDPLVLAAIDCKEFKTYVDLLVSRDPHLLFCRVENTGREYVNEIKTRLLKQLTNGFNTPALACSFMNVMFDEYSHLMNCARTVSSLLRPLEEQHLSRFCNATWEQHNMHLFQSMVHSEPVIQRTFSEILNQLRQDSSQFSVDSKHENMFTASLIKYLKFDTEMTQIGVAWRDVQKLIDDFNDERVEARRKHRRHKAATTRSEAKENWDFFKVQQETYKQILSNTKELHNDLRDARLSLTLRSGAFGPLSNHSVSDHKATDCASIKNESQLNTADRQQQTEYEGLTNGEENLYTSQPSSSADSNVVSFLSSEYLCNIRPPSVPSDDLEDSSDNDSVPHIITHPRLVVPSDLDGEIDSIGSMSPQLGSAEMSHTPFLHFDPPPNNILLNSAARSFILPTFHHARQTYNPHQHLHHLHKKMQENSDPVFVNGTSKIRPPSPNVKSRTESAVDPDHIALDVLLPDPDISPHLETLGGAIDVAEPSASSGDAEAKAESSNDSPVFCGNLNSPTSVQGNTSGATSLFSSEVSLASSTDGIYKDSWSSSSSSVSGFSSAPAWGKSEPELGKPRHKQTKAKKKAQRKLKGKPLSKTEENNCKNSLSNDTDTTNKVKTDEKDKTEIVEDGCHSDTEGEEDADDEYDDEDDEDIDADMDVCKCERCIAAMNLCRVSEPSRDYIPLNDPKQGYVMPGLDAGISTGGASCECPSCLRLAAVSFFASQSGQPTSNLSSFSQNDANGTSLNASVQNPFYTPMPQDLHSIIHPHLYGLPTMASSNPAQSVDQSTSSNCATFSSNCSLPKSPKLLAHDPAQDANPDGHMFNHVNQTNEWDVFGKTNAGKLVMNSAGQTGVSPNLPEWQISGHQAWLNGLGSGSGILPSHLVAPGGVSAFQQYMTSSTMAGAQGFLQPFIPGALSLPHTMHTPSFLTTQVDSERLFSSPSANKNQSSVLSTLTSTATSTCSASLASSSSFAPPNSMGSSTSTSMPPTTSTIFAPPSNYFSSPAYAPGTDMSTNPLPSFTVQSSAAGGVDAHPTSHATSHPLQSIRFHPGTSVILKDGQFTIDMPGNRVFKGPLPAFASEKTSIPTSPPQPSFTAATTLSQASCLQHNNSFLQHIPISSSPNLPCYSNLLPQNPLGAPACAANMTASIPPASSAANQLHIKQNILRRKKLVAQSKLSKQVRPPLQQQKMQMDPGSQMIQNQARMQAVVGKMQEDNNHHHQQQQPQAKMSAPSHHPPPAFAPPPLNNNPATSATTATTGSQCHPGDGNLHAQETQTSPNRSKEEKQKEAKSLPDATPCDKSHHPSKKSHEVDHVPHQPPTSDTCHHHEGHEGQNNANAASNAANSNGGNNNNCKYCNCCYCEFFGNGGPPPAPTSKNFQEIRERLRRKLNTNKQKSNEDEKPDSEHGKEHRHQTRDETNFFPGLPAQPTVEELLHYIEGDSNPEEHSKKMSKKARQRQKRENEKRKNEQPPALGNHLFDKEIKYVYTYERGSSKGKLVYPSPKSEEKEDTTTDKDSTAETDPTQERDVASDKNGKKKKKRLAKPDEQLLEQPKTNETKTSTKESKIQAGEQQAEKAKKTSKEQIIQAAATKPPDNRDAKKANATKEAPKSKRVEKPAQVKQKSTKTSINPELLSNQKSPPATKAAPDETNSTTSTTNVTQTTQTSTDKTKKAASKEANNAKKVNISAATTQTATNEKSSQTKVATEKPSQASTPQEHPKPPTKSEPSKTTAVKPGTSAVAEKVAAKSEPRSNDTSDEDMFPLLPQVLKKSELKRRRHLPRKYDAQQRQAYLNAVKTLQANETEFAKRFRPLRNLRIAADRPTLQDIERKVTRTQQQQQRQSLANLAKKSVAAKAPTRQPTNNLAQKKQPQTTQQQPAPPPHQQKKSSTSSQQSARETSNESVNQVDTSGSSTPEKQNEGDSTEVKKNRNRKQRKKNKGLPSTFGDNGSILDQVFLPREVLEEDAKEMDDAEKEIENFKRFCMDSTVLNKPKKITVNLKDFTFKKNHTTH